MAAHITTRKVANAKNDATPTVKDGGGVPSGFVLKLYQMVNDAPDEVISWLASGDAFRISNLQRLENETLPTFFRHRRFQSLVRQLNFYNFRKVNRERTFWVYRHPLFHRDRPNELHLLRRRTCPGVDGRKQRAELDMSTIESSGSNSISRPNSAQSSKKNNISSSGTSCQSDIVATPPTGKRKTRSTEETSNKKSRGERKVVQVLGRTESDKENTAYFESPPLPQNSSDTPLNVMFRSVVPETDDTDGIKGPNRLVHSISPLVEPVKKPRSNSLEISLSVSRVARRLEEHAKRAATMRKGGRRRSGTVTPQFVSDTMKYHALTYDDEIEIYDSERGCVVERRSSKVTGEQFTIVTDAYESEDETKASVVSNDESVETENSIKQLGDYGNNYNTHKEDRNINISKDLCQPPVNNASAICSIATKLHSWTGQSSFATRVDGQLAAAIAEFCMSTNPKDPSLERKTVELMCACAPLVTEFRRYKAALQPGCLPPEILNPKARPRVEVIIKQLFQGDVKNTVRVLKVFLLNSLEDLVHDPLLGSSVGLNVTEEKCIDECYKVWLNGIKGSAF